MDQLPPVSQSATRDHAAYSADDTPTSGVVVGGGAGGAVVGGGAGVVVGGAVDDVGGAVVVDDPLGSPTLGNILIDANVERDDFAVRTCDHWAASRTDAMDTGVVPCATDWARPVLPEPLPIVTTPHTMATTAVTAAATSTDRATRGAGRGGLIGHRPTSPYT